MSNLKQMGYDTTSKKKSVQKPDSEQQRYGRFCSRIRKELKEAGYDIPFNVVEAIAINMDENDIWEFAKINWVKKFTDMNYNDIKCPLSRQLNSYNREMQKKGIRTVIGDDLADRIKVSEMYSKRTNNLALYIDQKLIHEKYKQLAESINKRTEYKISFNRNEHPSIYDFAFPKGLAQIIISEKNGYDIMKDLYDVNYENRIVKSHMLYEAMQFKKQGLIERTGLSIKDLINISLNSDKILKNDIMKLIKIDNQGYDISFYINNLNNTYMTATDYRNYLNTGVLAAEKSIDAGKLFEKGLSADEIKDIIKYTKIRENPDTYLFAQKMIDNIENQNYYLSPENADYICKRSPKLLLAITNMDKSQLEILNNIHVLTQINDLDKLADTSLTPEQMEAIINCDRAEVSDFNVNEIKQANSEQLNIFNNTPGYSTVFKNTLKSLKESIKDILPNNSPNCDYAR